jgi:hypothetical protein
MLRELSLCLLLVSSALLAPQAVHAVLGGKPGTGMGQASDRNLVDRGTYSIQETRFGVYSIREYISPAEIVFAVAWNGLTTPDLPQLLGPFAGEYQKALQQEKRKKGARRSSVKTDRVVVQRWGHMRNLRGRAYVPALLPSGVGSDELK